MQHGFYIEDKPMHIESAYNDNYVEGSGGSMS